MLYRIDVQIAATAYINADSAQEAASIARELCDEVVEVSGTAGDVPISGVPFDELHEVVTLSPAMTILGPFDNGVEPEEVE